VPAGHVFVVWWPAGDRPCIVDGRFRPGPAPQKDAAIQIIPGKLASLIPWPGRSSSAYVFFLIALCRAMKMTEKDSVPRSLLAENKFRKIISTERESFKSGLCGQS